MNRANAIRSRLIGAWSCDDLCAACSHIGPSGASDILLMLEDEGTDCAWALRRLLILSAGYAGTTALADPVVHALTRENPTIPRMLADVVKYITDDDDGADVLAVHRRYHPEAWDAVQASMWALAKERMVSIGA